MTDKEKIKQEIERRINISLEQGYTYSAAQLKRIIDFINSLPEEPASEDLEEDCSFEKILQEIYIQYDKKISIESLLDIASHFAEWQRKKDQESSCEADCATKDENLDSLVISLEETIGTSPHSREVIKEYLQKATELQKQQMNETLQTEYEKGLFDMREEIMKDAVDRKYLEDWYISSIDETKPPIWTDAHIDEVLKDFYLIPKEALQ